MKRKDYSSPQAKVLRLASRQSIMAVSGSGSFIGSEDLGIEFTNPVPGRPEDAY